MKSQKYFNIRVVSAISLEQAIKKIEVGRFIENHNLSDKVLTNSELIDQLPKFPNGFTSWMETHYEIVEAITLALQKNGSSIDELYETGGRGSVYELSEDMTNRFEVIHAGNDWSGDDFFTELEKFIEDEFNKL